MHDPESAARTRAVRARGGAAAARLRTYRSRARALEHHAHLAEFTADVLYDLLDGALDHHAARVLLAGASLQARLIDLRRKEEDEWGAAPSADLVSPHPRIGRTPRHGTGRAARAWARDLDPHRSGFETEARMLRQLMQEAFTTGNHPAVRHHAEALRRLLHARTPAPGHDFDEDSLEGEDGLTAGLSADLRRVLQRVGVDMGIDA